MEDVKITETTSTESNPSTSSTTTTANKDTETKSNLIEANDNVVKVTENTTTILYNNQNEVFYNPVQEFNRDMSILMIRMFIEEKKREMEAKGKPFKKVRILEALSATGLRSIRYAKEIDDLDYILANDIEQSAVDSIVKNRAYNGVEESLIRPNLGDASLVMMQNRSYANNYDIVDVDPYGAPTVFLDSAVQAVADGGLLCVTATDSAVLCGSYPEACFHKYQSVPIHRANYCHEMGLRILLHSIEQHANRYKRHIVPILSLSVDFYVRVFVRVYYSPSEAKKAFSKMCNIYSCTGCGSFVKQPLGVVKQEENGSIKYKTPMLTKELTQTTCNHCSKVYQVAGPFWANRIHDVEFCKKALKYLDENPTKFNTSRRMFGILTSVCDEVQDSMFYFKTDHFTHTLHLSTPATAMIKSAILNGGYKCSSSHILPCIKTDAPFDFIWDIFREYAKEKPPKNLSEHTPAFHILAKEIKHKVDFTKHPLAKGEHPDVPKYFPNPKENWGPGSRAKGKNLNNKRDGDEAQINNKKRNQKKKKEPTTCKYFLLNKCIKGDKCENIHDNNNNNNNNNVENKSEPATSTTVETKN
ncbi:hypothetical protein DICPUDRAFT_48748 [Dictyostelium purpureum]|uniref:tRNA (guanine(26)-N(2))-dimethyltransferase n=1 Tax=Dictyostelium purpureum TaxID=5786 RepID=F0ZQF8_DICPU|nr:uncharacterized protein DICPUDRAFT_48748 [Dictyostelium purpureum]EGC33821.1 hypothetical protein DICPUDRAFT_48748 [Dictyostelium purpureum]|eukprot:XP_003289647.1 hypothetical protein DICPUDRAFT_48748 [Dictyostelium purpureum]